MRGKVFEDYAHNLPLWLFLFHLHSSFSRPSFFSFFGGVSQSCLVALAQTHAHEAKKIFVWKKKDEQTEELVSRLARIGIRDGEVVVEIGSTVGVCRLYSSIAIFWRRCGGGGGQILWWVRFLLVERRWHVDRKIVEPVSAVYRPLSSSECRQIYRAILYKVYLGAYVCTYRWYMRCI